MCVCVRSNTHTRHHGAHGLGAADAAQVPRGGNAEVSTSARAAGDVRWAAAAGQAGRVQALHPRPVERRLHGPVQAVLHSRRGSERVQQRVHFPRLPGTPRDTP